MSREKRTILIVDGSSTMVFYLGMLLKRLEYVVMSVRNGEDALKTLERGLPSAVLTDVALPVMSGIELLKAIKNHEQYRHVPVIVQCADRDQALKASCISMGCAAFLKKPVEPGDLYRTLQAAIESTPRHTIRLNTSLPVTVGDDSASGGVRRSEYASAISEGGLYIRTQYPQPRNAITPIRISLGGREISVRAEVLYSYVENEGPYKEAGMGMKFVEISDNDRLLIREFIKEQLTKDIGS
ncbi:MAG: response regulator [Nitrospirota bacterium]|nr:response regulator [Nitrospirota bacterium]